MPLNILRPESALEAIFGPDSRKAADYTQVHYADGGDVAVSVMRGLEELIGKLQANEDDWEQFSAFWPPRRVRAYKERRLAIFFGAGLSVGAGLPDWGRLLRERFRMDPAFLDDPILASDR